MKKSSWVLKSILGEILGDFLTFLTKKEYTPIIRLNTEIFIGYAKRREADYFVHCKIEGEGEEHIHIEFIEYNEPEFPIRMLTYFIGLHRKYNVPIRQLVLYYGTLPPKFLTELKIEDVEYKYTLIDLGKIKAEDIIKAKKYSLYPLFAFIDREGRKNPEKYLEKCITGLYQIPGDVKNRKAVIEKTEMLLKWEFGSMLFDKIFEKHAWETFYSF